VSPERTNYGLKTAWKVDLKTGHVLNFLNLLFIRVLVFSICVQNFVLEFSDLILKSLLSLLSIVDLILQLCPDLVLEIDLRLIEMVVRAVRIIKWAFFSRLWLFFDTARASLYVFGDFPDSVEVCVLSY
jgi:hypothetical protein